jgi:hypothetical protein
MKKIALSRNKFALVDNADYPLLSRYKWSYGADGYALRWVGTRNGKQRFV